jgi:UPF0176 protein
LAPVYRILPACYRAPPMFAVSAFYRFQTVADPAALRDRLQTVLGKAQARGIVLVAAEGVNATIAAPMDRMSALMGAIERTTGMSFPARRLSRSDRMPFKRLKVRIKKEIVTIGDRAIDPRERVGTYVKPADWNALIADPDVLVIDTRNGFEHAFGTFEGARDPGTESFHDFPAYVREALAGRENQKIALFCTGGIRCEKATSLLVEQGFADVCHLEGGILRYLDEIPPEESLWRGGCFVFDERVALTHGLEPTGQQLCLACNAPIDVADRGAQGYEPGVSCPACVGRTSPERKASARERQRQFAAAGTAPRQAPQDRHD